MRRLLILDVHVENHVDGTIFRGGSKNSKLFNKLKNVAIFFIIIFIKTSIISQKSIPGLFPSVLRLVQLISFLVWPGSLIPFDRRRSRRDRILSPILVLDSADRIPSNSAHLNAGWGRYEVALLIERGRREICEILKIIQVCKHSKAFFKSNFGKKFNRLFKTRPAGEIACRIERGEEHAVFFPLETMCYFAAGRV